MAELLSFDAVIMVEKVADSDSPVCQVVGNAIAPMKIAS
jgi:hypothetical protein